MIAHSSGTRTHTLLPQHSTSMHMAWQTTFAHHLPLGRAESEWWGILVEIDFRFPRFADIVRRFAVAIRDIPCLAIEFDGVFLASEVIRLCEVRHNTSLLVDFTNLRVEVY